MLRRAVFWQVLFLPIPACVLSWRTESIWHSSWHVFIVCHVNDAGCQITQARDYGCNCGYCGYCGPSAELFENSLRPDRTIKHPMYISICSILALLTLLLTLSFPISLLASFQQPGLLSDSEWIQCIQWLPRSRYLARMQRIILWSYVLVVLVWALVVTFTLPLQSDTKLQCTVPNVFKLNVKLICYKCIWMNCWRIWQRMVVWWQIKLNIPIVTCPTYQKTPLW